MRILVTDVKAAPAGIGLIPDDNKGPINTVRFFKFGQLYNERVNYVYNLRTKEAKQQGVGIEVAQDQDFIYQLKFKP